MKFTIYNDTEKICIVRNAKKARAIINQSPDLWAISQHQYFKDIVMLQGASACKKFGYSGYMIAEGKNE